MSGSGCKRGPWVVAALSVAVALVVMFWIWHVHAECSKRMCQSGREAQRLSGMCICIERPLP